MPSQNVWIALAPMEGVVDASMRALLTEIGGLDHTTTEFIRVTDRLLPHHVIYDYAPELRNGGRTDKGTPVFIQLLGGQPGPMAENAAQIAEMGALGIDLNFGCPAKTVNRHDGGATLLKNPERVFGVTSAVRKAMPRETPLTVKVRLGFEHKEFATEIAKAAEAGGASRLTVHARTRNEMYTPPAHWEYIALMREALAIPVVANGEIWSVEDYIRCRQVTGCTSFALGRGLLSRPDLASQIKQFEFESKVSPLPWLEIRAHLQLMALRLEKISDRLAIGRIKQWCRFLSRNYSEALVLFNEIKVLNNIADICRQIEGDRVYSRHAPPSESYQSL